MTLEEAIRKNPFDETKGNLSAYARYLRYNVDGLYHYSNEEVRIIYDRHMFFTKSAKEQVHSLNEIGVAFAKGFEEGIKRRWDK